MLHIKIHTPVLQPVQMRVPSSFLKFVERQFEQMSWFCSFLSLSRLLLYLVSKARWAASWALKINSYKYKHVTLQGTLKYFKTMFIHWWHTSPMRLLYNPLRTQCAQTKRMRENAILTHRRARMVVWEIYRRYRGAQSQTSPSNLPPLLPSHRMADVPPNQTLYVNNISEKVKVPGMHSWDQHIYSTLIVIHY